MLAVIFEGNHTCNALCYW